MNPQTNDQPPTEDALGVVSMFLVGLAVITFAFFPLLLPGLAVVALFAVPIVAPVIPVLLIWALLAVGLFVVRWMRGRSGRGILRTQPLDPRRENHPPRERRYSS
jgi:hypothetical protein